MAYLERVSLFFEANEIARGKRVTWFLNLMGVKTYLLVHNLVAPFQPKNKSFDQIVTTLKEHFELKRFINAQRFYFHCRDQMSEETIADNIAESRRLVTPCDFGEYLNEALRDRLVCGLCNEGIQKQLLSEVGLTLARAVTIAQNLEAAC